MDRDWVLISSCAVAAVTAVAAASYFSNLLLSPHQTNGIKLYLVKTFHKRFRPKIHSFSYSLFYIGYTFRFQSSQKEPSRSSLLFARNRWNMMAIWDTDYLLKSKEILLESKLIQVLKEFGIV